MPLRTGILETGVPGVLLTGLEILESASGGMLLTGVLIRLRADNLAIGVSPVGESYFAPWPASCPNAMQCMCVDLEVIKKEKTNCSKNFIKRSQ